MDRQIEELINLPRGEPHFSFNNHDFGRGLVNTDKNTDRITRTLSSNCWRIVDNELQDTKAGNNGILFNAETFLIQWDFEYSITSNDEVNIGTVFYHWKGCNAPKGLSPLPPNFDNNTSIVDRICQWSEPFAFFRIFPKCLVVLDGQKNEFDASSSHLFMVRGELKEEIHMYELPFSKKNLRSRAVFFMVVPSDKSIYIWWGASVSSEFKLLIRSLNLDRILKTIDDEWRSFGIKQMNEGEEDSLMMRNGKLTYLHIDRVLNSTPRLFYCNSITGEFLMSEIEYPLKVARHVAAFPFLQSHLYSADQPALFILIDQSDIWIWKRSDDDDDEEFDNLNQLVETTASEYVRRIEMSTGISISMRFIEAGSEPLEFINKFPFWMMNE